MNQHQTMITRTAINCMTWHFFMLLFQKPAGYAFAAHMAIPHANAL